LDKVAQTGIVRRIKGSSAEIEITRGTACGGQCSSCSGGCAGTGIIVSLHNGVGAKVGDIVRIESRASSVVGSALVVYLLPIVMMILGMTFGRAIMQKIYPSVSTDIAGLVFGFGALLIFYYVLKTLDRRLFANKKQPVISKILNR